MRKLASLSLVGLISLGLVSCGGNDLSRAQLDWCDQNQNQVADMALQLGLMRSGDSYTRWKQDDQNGYLQACAEAAGPNPVEPSPTVPL